VTEPSLFIRLKLFVLERVEAELHRKTAKVS
jgi:hypothetical protein